MSGRSNAREEYEDMQKRQRYIRLKNEAWEKIYKYLFEFSENFKGDIQVEDLNLSLDWYHSHVSLNEQRFNALSDSRYSNDYLIRPTTFSFGNSRVIISETNGNKSFDELFEMKLYKDKSPKETYEAKYSELGDIRYRNFEKGELLANTLIDNWWKIKRQLEAERDKRNLEKESERELNRNFERRELDSKIYRLEKFKV